MVNRLNYKAGNFIYPSVLTRNGFVDICYSVQCPVCQHSEIVYDRIDGPYCCEYCGSEFDNIYHSIVFRAKEDIKIEKIREQSK